MAQLLSLLAGFFLNMETLKRYLVQYKARFSEKTFEIFLSNGESFQITFKDYNFAHLLGLSHCAKGKQVKQFSGLKAIEGIENGTLTFDYLKSIDLKSFNKFVEKKIAAFEMFLDIFPSKPYLLEAALFESDRMIKTADRTLEKAKLVLQDKANPRIKYIFVFGEETNNGVELLFPLSFRKEEGELVDFLDLQTKFKITKIEEK